MDLNLLFYTGMCIVHIHQELGFIKEWEFIKENLAFLGQQYYFGYNLAKMHQLNYISALGCYIFYTCCVDTPLGHIVGHFCAKLNGQNYHKLGYGQTGHY